MLYMDYIGMILVWRFRVQGLGLVRKEHIFHRD